MFTTPIGSKGQYVNHVPVLSQILAAGGFGRDEFQRGLPPVRRKPITRRFTGTQRPNLVGILPFQQRPHTGSLVQHFAFTVAPARTTGNAAATRSNGPAINNFDLALMRKVRFASA